MQNIIKLQLHSMTDLITNSSTVIYTYSDASLDACKAMINEIFKSFNINKTCDDVFNLSITYNDSSYYEESRYLPEEISSLDSNTLYETIQDILKQVKAGKIAKPEWMLETERKYYNGNDYKPGTTLNIVPKAPKYSNMAKLIENFLYSTHSESCYDG